jgi:uncharacterized protein YbjT (DUF2867 family)
MAGKTVVVAGATGMQGRPIVETLIAGGFGVRALTRQAAPNLSEGAIAMRGDLGDVASLRSAFGGADALVLLLPLIFDEAQVAGYARNVVEAARAAGLRRVVFDTSAPVPDAPVGVPAVAVKRAAEDVLRAADLDLTVIRPTIYMGNLAAPWTAPGIVADRTVAYPLAADLRCAWITWEDVAACVAAALGDDATIGRTYDVGGPEALDGAGVAAAFETARGAPHSYAAVPLDAFEAGLGQAIGPEAGREIAALYRWLNADGAEHLSAAANGTAALGVETAAMRDWVGHVPWEALAGDA